LSLHHPTAEICFLLQRPDSAWKW